MREERFAETAAAADSGPSYVEFVVLVSLMMSLAALSTDAMLPALPQIASDLRVAGANDRQLVVSTLFLGLAAGQLFFGPLSDSIGRKPAVYAGYAVYTGGALLALFAGSFPVLLAGRLLQGLGIAGPRAITLALVRDRYEGRAMARVMSFVMTVFIFVPMIAPLLGQALLNLSGWRSIFGSFVLLALLTLTWFAVRMPETLNPADRVPFSASHIAGVMRQIFSIRVTLGYTITAGLVSGAHLGYLNSAQQLIQELYGLGDLFAGYFALIALAIGVASFSNARLVMRFGMRHLVRWALLAILLLAVLGLGAALLADGRPPLWFFTLYLLLTFFSVGILFGNQNALAMEPLGRVAGTGAAVVGSLSTLLAVPIGVQIGRAYNGTVFPLLGGMALLAFVSLLVIRWVERP